MSSYAYADSDLSPVDLLIGSLGHHLVDAEISGAGDEVSVTWRRGPCRLEIKVAAGYAMRWLMTADGRADIRAIDGVDFSSVREALDSMPVVGLLPQ